MIPARPNRFFSAWFSREAESRIAKSFASVRVYGLEALQETLANGDSVLVVSNHTAWWDPMVAIYLCRRVLRANAYAMMDAANLRRLPFFGLVGAFGVDLGDAKDGARAMRYAVKMLRRKTRIEARTIVWVFAQGREVPVTVRPLGFRPGSGEIERLSGGATVASVALRYEMGAEPEPTLWISIQVAPANNECDAHELTTIHEARVTSELERIDRGITLGETESFVTLMNKKPSRLFEIATWGLALFTRGAAKSEQLTTRPP